MHNVAFKVETPDVKIISSVVYLRFRNTDKVVTAATPAKRFAFLTQINVTMHDAETSIRVVKTKQTSATPA